MANEEKPTMKIPPGGLRIRNTAREITELRELVEYCITKLRGAGSHYTAEEVQEKLDKIQPKPF